MAIETDEIELSITGIEKFQKENPKTWAHILHNWDAIKTALDSGALSTDLSSLQASIAAMQITINALQAQVDAIDTTQFDPSGLQAQIDALQAQVDAIVIPLFPPPFAMPDGTNGQILTHGPGGNGDFFFADPVDIDNLIYAPAQMEDLVIVNEGTDEEQTLPVFVLDDDGRIMMIPVG